MHFLVVLHLTVNLAATDALHCLEPPVRQTGSGLEAPAIFINISIGNLNGIITISNLSFCFYGIFGMKTSLLLLLPPPWVGRTHTHMPPALLGSSALSHLLSHLTFSHLPSLSPSLILILTLPSLPPLTTHKTVWWWLCSFHHAS